MPHLNIVSARRKVRDNFRVPIRATIIILGNKLRLTVRTVERHHNIRWTFRLNRIATSSLRSELKEVLLSRSANFGSVAFAR
ncbi:MAG: hypothetical protein BROFUL_01725 [Candidatus Brocadia fulgida]|uniref:Uncharacterized protein n=1 Tax=Candidatus Brocadia fulgida TaxID=380242 RepID=A0A0M2UYJ9_9BACT|nr:MAG: hypothetical protein BROFUL_01725 [Candidatus Brocadia fulgida]